MGKCSGLHSECTHPGTDGPSRQKPPQPQKPGLVGGGDIRRKPEAKINPVAVTAAED